LSNTAPPSIRAILRRDYPSQTFGAFAVLFGLGAIIGGAAMATADPKDRDFAAIFAGLFALFALGCAVVFALRLRWIMRLVRRGVVVDGIVRRNEANSEEIWFLDVEYEFAGTKYRTTKGTGLKSRFAVGDAVRLLVDPERPDRAWIAD